MLTSHTSFMLVESVDVALVSSTTSPDNRLARASLKSRPVLKSFCEKKTTRTKRERKKNHERNQFKQSAVLLDKLNKIRVLFCLVVIRKSEKHILKMIFLSRYCARNIEIGMRLVHNNLTVVYLLDSSVCIFFCVFIYRKPGIHGEALSMNSTDCSAHTSNVCAFCLFFILDRVKLNK